MAEDEQDFSKLPLEERCTHKSWKARVAGYEELIKLFKRIDDEKSPEWSKYASIVRKLPMDSNAAALEKGLEAAFLFMENSSIASKLVAEVMSGVVAKCIIAAKARSKELASEISLMCVEIEKFEAVQEELMKGMDHKNPRIVSGCIAITTQSCKDFGPKVLNLKTLLKKVLPLIEDRDKGVRDEVKKLTVELHHWLGPGFKPQLANLKPVLLQELEVEFNKLEGKPQPQRYLKSQQAKKERAALEGGDAEVEEIEQVDTGGANEIDPYDLLDPVDILSKLPKDFYEKTEAKKWQERKEAMEVLEKLVTENLKLEAGDYADLVRTLKRIISKDSNVVVVASAGKCVAGLANGLKKKFSPYAASTIGTILEKFKEKKASVVTAMREAIDASFAATSLEHIQEDLVTSLQGKNPAVKIETAAFLARAFAKVPNKTMVDKKFMKPFHTALLVNVNESDPAVRDAASEALGVALKAAGEKNMSTLFQDLDPLKLQKIKDFAKTAVITAPKPAPAPAKPPPKQAPPKAEKPAESKAPAATKKAPSPKKPGTIPRKPTEKKDVAKSPSIEELNEMKPVQPVEVVNDDPNRRIDISSQLTSHLVDSLSDKNWKTREEALDKISAIISNAKNIQPNLGDLPNALAERLQDSNRNLSANAFLVCQNLAAVLGPHCKQHLPTLLPNMLGGLSDSKPTIRNTVIACVNTWAENAGIKEVFQREVIADALKAGNPYLRQEVFQWLTVRLPQLKAVNKDDLTACLPFVYGCIEDRNPDVRRRAQEVILPFMIHLGYEGMSRATSKLKPSSKTAIQALLDKARPNLPAKQPAAAAGGKALAGSKSGSTLKQGGAKASNNEAHASNNSLNQTFNSASAVDEKSKTLEKGRGGIGKPRQSQFTKAGSPNGEYSPPLNGQQRLSPGQTSPPMVNANNARRDTYANLNSAILGANHAMQGGMGVGNIVEPNRHHLPQQYQINYEMIDNMFGPQDLMPMPPLQLLDTNIEHLSKEVPANLPPRRVMTLPQTLSAIPVLVPRAAQALDLVVSQVGNPDLRTSMEAIVQLETLINDPEYSNVMGERVDHLLSIITMQLRKLQPMLSSSSPEKIQEMNQLYRCIVQLLQALYKQGPSPLASNGTKNTVRELIYHLLTLIIDPNITILPDATFICKTVNVLVVRVIEHSDANAVICGLIRLLNDTLQMKNNPRLLDLVMKCQWKLLKQFSEWGADHSYNFDLDSIIREFHAFIKVNPFTGPNARDLTPIKTMKTILHALVMHVGGEKVLKALYKMPDLQGSETEVYISKLIQRECSKKRSENNIDSNSNTEN
ncbi:unnamed protein product [Allacma fusca]|uniref:TOG domain-containing protein n=1 Tax=Allacma fusca TaxID=39272 RepID=A0A8J2PP05_9HEXA|nr:unnamed protein product [Allacma fusca]